MTRTGSLSGESGSHITLQTVFNKFTRSTLSRPCRIMWVHLVAASFTNIHETIQWTCSHFMLTRTLSFTDSTPTPTHTKPAKLHLSPHATTNKYTFYTSRTIEVVFLVTPSHSLNRKLICVQNATRGNNTAKKYKACTHFRIIPAATGALSLSSLSVSDWASRLLTPGTRLKLKV